MCSAVGKYRRRDGEETLGRRALRTESGHGPTARSAAAGAGARRAGLQEEDGRRQREPGAQGGCREGRRHQDVEPSATGDAAARAGAAGRRAQPLVGRGRSFASLSVGGAAPTASSRLARNETFHRLDLAALLVAAGEKPGWKREAARSLRHSGQRPRGQGQSRDAGHLAHGHLAGNGKVGFDTETGFSHYWLLY